MSVHDKAKLSTAVSHFSNIDLSGQHVTTSNFMELNVAKSLELVPNQSISINHSLFTRLEPMPVPTFGNARVNCKAFFVPFRTVMPAWNEFITDSVYVNSYDSSYIPENVHLIKNSTFVEMFIGSSPFSRQVGTAEEADIVIINDSDPEALVYYKLLPRGRQVMKVLMSLGYKIDFNMLNAEFYHSALPLLCYFKIYLDWYYPSAYSQDEYAIRLQFLLDYDDSELPFDEFITSGMLREFINFTVDVCYNSDYFTSAWDNPIAPNSNSYSNVQIPDITVNTSTTSQSVATIGTQTGGTPVLRGATGTTASNLSQYALTALQSLSDYMKRFQLSGARVVDRYLARYGVSLSSAKIKRSQFIGEYSQEIKFGDVTSSADTEGAQLGSFAGKGVSFGHGTYEFSTDEFGMLIILTSIVPKVAFYQGQDRITMHKTRLDFFTEEFDNLGVQALATRELYVPMDSRKQYPEGTEDFQGLNYNKLVFGFVPRYGEYKRGTDLITGDYVLNSLNTGKDAWTLMRDVAPFFNAEGIEGSKHDLDFVQGNDSAQYNRIFYLNSNLADHFNIIHDFNITSRFPGKSLYDTYEFENEDEAKKVIMEVNGVKAN